MHLTEHAHLAYCCPFLTNLITTGVSFMKISIQVPYYHMRVYGAFQCLKMWYFVTRFRSLYF